MNKKVLGVALWLCSFAAPSAKANAAAEPLRISYTLKSTARVSLNIYDAKGQIVRELLHTASRKAGAQAEQWDGRDDAGKPLPTGKYSWKMLGVPGFGAEYITSPGASYPVRNDEPFWAQSPGSHGGPISVAVDATGFYVGASGTEGIETGLIKQSVDGAKREWSALSPTSFTGYFSLASVNGSLWAYSPHTGQVYRFDQKTGARATAVVDGKFNGAHPSDMAANGSHILLSYPAAGVVRWFDHSGVETRNVVVAGANSVDVAGDGTAYVISGKTLVKIAVGATSATTLIKDLSTPSRAAVNPANGDIYLVDGNQIKRYSSAGTLLKTFGTAAGRLDGLYQSQKESFRGVADIAVNAAGDFWIAEGNASPHRTAHFDAGGKWVKEWYGGQLWAPFITPEPDDPHYVWMASHWGEMMRVYVDYEKKYWRVHSCYRFADMANGLIGNHDIADDWQAKMHNNTLYLCRVRGYPEVIKVDRTNWKLIPVVKSVASLGHDPFRYPQWLKDYAAGKGGISMLWTDANGDGLALNADASIQINEVSVFPTPAAYAANSLPDPNFNWITSGGGRKFSVASWNAVGAPVYGSFPAGEAGVAAPPRQGGAYDDRWSTYTTKDAGGNIWGGFNPNITGWGGSADAFVARWNPNGALAWQSGRIAAGKPGSLGTFRHIFGVINNGTNYNCLVIGRFSNEWPQEGVTPLYVYDQDGLYAGQLIGKPLNTDVANWRYGLGAEALSGSILKDSAGKVYFFSHWINEGRIYKITGWDGWQRSSGSVNVPEGYAAPEFTPEPIGPSGNGTGLKGEYFTSADLTGTPASTKVDPVMDIPAATLGNHSVRWTGTLTPRRSGWHMFDQARGFHTPNAIWVNGVNVSEVTLLPADSAAPGWPGGGYHDGTGRTIWLDAGKGYPIRIDYRRDLAHPIGVDGIQLLWSEPETNGVFTGIPQSQLSPVSIEPKKSSQPVVR